uniref:OmpH family outer membrane protein n=1 Tax=Geobacter metallireducens TaxID=28232 RepID=A0A831U2Q7_GEOME
MKPIAVLALLSCIISFSAMADELPRTEPQPAGEPLRAAETVPPQPPVKIGYVDIARIASDSAPGKAANARLKEKTEKLRSQIVGKQKTLEKMKKDLEAQLPTLSPQQRQARIKALEKKVAEYQKFVQGAEKDMQKMEGELSEAMIKAIQKAADDYGKANGFAAIVPKRDLFYLGDKVEVIDVTGDLMKIIP